ASPCQKRVYCGRDCYNTDKIQKGQAEKIEQAAAKQKVSSLVTLYCKLCSKEFTASKWAERIYCSKPCYFADPNRKKGPVKYPEKWQTVVCLNCGKMFETYSKHPYKFCSKACYKPAGLSRDPTKHIIVICQK